MLTRLLYMCGLYLGVQSDLLQPLADNPEGFWEHLGFQSINEQLLELLGGGWDYPPDTARWQVVDTGPLRTKARVLLSEFLYRDPWGWKDPRNSLTLPFWKALLPSLRVVICLRNPEEVVQSLRVRNNFSRAHSLHLWHEYNRRLLEESDPTMRLVTHYEALLHNGPSELRRILAFLEIPTDEPTIARACTTIAEGQRHYLAAAPSGAGDNLGRTAAELYLQMCDEARWRCRGSAAPPSVWAAQTSARGGTLQHPGSISKQQGLGEDAGDSSHRGEFHPEPRVLRKEQLKIAARQAIPNPRVRRMLRIGIVLVRAWSHPSRVVMRWRHVTRRTLYLGGEVLRRRSRAVLYRRLVVQLQAQVKERIEWARRLTDMLAVREQRILELEAEVAVLRSQLSEGPPATPGNGQDSATPRGIGEAAAGSFGGSGPIAAPSALWSSQRPSLHAGPHQDRHVQGLSDASTPSARPKVLVLGIYLADRINSVDHVVSILSQTTRYDVAQRWVALGGGPRSPVVQAVTVMHRPTNSAKYRILNDLLAKENLGTFEHTVLVDDDILLPDRFLDSFLLLQSQVEFVIAQPARTSNSHIDHPIVEQQPGFVARQTWFVEQGPVVSFHRSVYDLVFPFDLLSPMGWGYENLWAHRVRTRGLKMGIIDATPVDHSLRKPGAYYNARKAMFQQAALLARHPHVPITQAYEVVEAITIDSLPRLTDV